LHMAQLMPLPLTVSCFSKIQIGFAFLVPAHPGSPGQRAVKRVCVCVLSYVGLFSVLSQWQTFIRVLPTIWRRKPAGIDITSLSPRVLAADPCRRLAWSTNTPFYPAVQPPRGTARQTVNSRQPSLCGCGSTHLQYTVN